MRLSRALLGGSVSFGPEGPVLGRGGGGSCLDLFGCLLLIPSCLCDQPWELLNHSTTPENDKDWAILRGQVVSNPLFLENPRLQDVGLSEN